jgi:DNA gyrase subunit A
MVAEPTNQTVFIEEEMKKSYLEYSMSVIVGRALPDIRDGLKPVHRRVLYAMYELKNYHNRPFKKSARIVGDVIGKYHPHGDAAVYDTIVRMAQDFNMRYPLVDGQGNFGSVDGDPPAAMRYTEVRMTRLAEDFLSDIEKETVNFTSNYDGTLKEPEVLPTTIPNLLINGSSGIAVGMATNIPPHNLNEICEAINKLIDEPEMTIEELIKIVPGPDFPTAGYIMGNKGIIDAYRTGRGIIKIRARAFIERVSKNRERIIITEIPYQVNKARLLEKIAELIKEKKIEGISDIRDESDRDGMRIVIDIKSDAKAPVILNRLYKFTQMEISFGIIFLAIVQGRPRVLNLKEIIEQFIDHRKRIIRKRSLFELKKAQERAHIVEGLKKALNFIDEVIQIIRSSTEVKEAKIALMNEFDLTDVQAQAILDMRLQRLTGMEREKLNEEYRELIKKISYLNSILENPSMVLQIIKEETEKIKEIHGDERRTEILPDAEEIDIEDLIADEEMVVTISHRGYIKRNPMSLYRAQKRGGKGLTGAKISEDDFIELLFVASSHDYLMFFTNLGRVHWKKVHEIPEAGRVSKGKSIVNLLNLKKGERIATTISVRDFHQGEYVVMATKRGIVKKTPLKEYSNPRSTGIIGLKINEGDELIGVRITDGDHDIFLTTRKGKSIRFHESQLRSMGRVATGNMGIRLDIDDQVVSMETIKNGETILTVTENGYGKRTPTEQYRVQSRNGKGILTIRITERNGPVIYAYQVSDKDQMIIITDGGKIIRFNVMDIPITGRATQGVKLIDLSPGERVSSVAKVIED